MSTLPPQSRTSKPTIPKPNIQWREWGQEAFLAAKAESKPVLLTLTATWCHWCHVMDQTSYSDSKVIALVNTGFIPVRVDVDQRPDISLRYNQGGFPSMALLDSQGHLIAGRVYTPPEEMALLLERVSSEYGSPASGPEEPDTRTAAVPATVPGEHQDSSPVESVLHRLQEIYDRGFGGFGLEPKQPPWEALGLLLARYSRTGDKNLLDMATATLQGIHAGLYDGKDTGFFRYSVSRDWKVPHYEKMLYTNASLAITYLEAFQVTGQGAYRAAATGALDYLLGALYDEPQGFFYASQDAGEEYYRLPWQDRDRAARPAIDRAFYTGWNALAAISLLRGFSVLGGPRYLQVATRVLDEIWNHARIPISGLQHTIQGLHDAPTYLADHVHATRAYLELHQVTGDAEALQRAETLAQDIQRLFGAEDSGFYDVSNQSPTSEVFPRQEKPLLENSLLAEALVQLSYLVDDDRYLRIARDALALFRDIAPGSCYLGPPGSRRMEEDEERLFLPAGSAWGRAWDALEHGPVHMVLVGRTGDRRTRRLLKTALRIHAPHKIVQLLDPLQDLERLATLGFPAGDAPQLYICMGGMCLAPIATPREVRRVASTRPWATTVQFTTQFTSLEY